MTDPFAPPSPPPAAPGTPPYGPPYGPPPSTGPGPFAPPQHLPRPDPFRVADGPASPATRRRRVVIGVTVGVTALLVLGGVALAATYVVDNAATLLASPSDLPEDAWYDDEWSDDGWSEDEVWSDSVGTGTLGNPWSVGSTVYGPEWDVTLGTPRDATAEILAATPAAAPPDDGFEYWVAPASAYYWGMSEEVDEPKPVRLSFVDHAGVEHTTPCPDVPGALVTTGPVAVDATLVGSLCVAVPAGAEGAWRLTLGYADPVHLTVR